jgi:hypothetical protein
LPLTLLFFSSSIYLAEDKSSKLLVVLGATGYQLSSLQFHVRKQILANYVRLQGGSVVATYLKRPKWKIRAITRDPLKPTGRRRREWRLLKPTLMRWILWLQLLR